MGFWIEKYRELVTKICEKVGLIMIVIATLMFFCIWFLMFCYQFRSDKKYDGRIDMKEYVFSYKYTM